MSLDIKNIKKGCFVYSLNEEDNSASIIDTISAAGNIIIPSFFNYESKEYTVTRISESAFNGLIHINSIRFAPNSQLSTIGKNAFIFSSITKISIPPSLTKIEESAFYWCEKLHDFEIPENSELRTIEKSAFGLTSIESIKIPSSLVDLKDGWCECMDQLTTITISPNNPRYKMYEDKFIIGKSSMIDKENFDVLVFCVRNIKIAKIPNFIEIIGQNAFERCNELQQIEFPNDSKLQLLDKNSFAYSKIECISIPSHLKIIGEKVFNYCEQFRRIEIPENSELQTIEENAFCDSSIESIEIPSSIIELKEGWCCCTPKLTKIKVDQNNHFYKTYEDKFIIGKSSIEKENFDVLTFCVRNIKIAKIPSFIEIIDACSFNECERLRKVEFSNDSNLQSIKKYAFSCSSIQSISIPQKTTKICEGAFSYCKCIQKVVFSNNLKLSKIEKKAFFCTSIVSFSVPSSITEIGEGSFESCKSLQIVEIGQNFNLKSIIEKSFNGYNDIIIFMMPINSFK